MNDERLSLRDFIAGYRRVRRVEGFATADAAAVAALPFRDLSGTNRAIWRVRALHYLQIRACLELIPGIRRVLDLGAGNGWLARRLSGRYQATALDVDDGPTALGAIAGAPFHRVCGELDHLPFAAGRFEAVVVAAALHHSSNVGVALGEVARVLVPRGVMLLADSPFYADDAAREGGALRTAAYYASLGEGELASRYAGLTRAEIEAPGLFRFVTLAPGISLRAAMASRRRGRPPGARLPLLLGLRRYR